MEQNKSNKILIPVIILIAFIALIGFVSMSLYGQVLDNEVIIIGQDTNIAGLQGDLNSTAMAFEGKKSELIVANANVAALTSEVNRVLNIKNSTQVALDTKNNEYAVLMVDNNALAYKVNDLNLQLVDLNTYIINLDANYDITLSIIDDVNNDGRLLYNLFNTCYDAAVCANDINADCHVEINDCLSVSDSDQNRVNIFQ